MLNLIVLILFLLLCLYYFCDKFPKEADNASMLGLLPPLSINQKVREDVFMDFYRILNFTEKK